MAVLRRSDYVAALDLAGAAEAIPALLRLDELCRADAVVRGQLAAVEAGLEELGPELEDARRELARRVHDREELLGEAGAEDEAGYLMRLEAFEERKDLLRTIAEADARLRERIGHAAAAFLDELAADILSLQRFWQHRPSVGLHFKMRAQPGLSLEPFHDAQNVVAGSVELARGPAMERNVEVYAPFRLGRIY